MELATHPETAPATTTLASHPPEVTELAFLGVLGVRTPRASSSGVEVFVGCHALNCYN
jgi:hypothetical protein